MGRRGFLRAGAGAVLLTAAACGKKKSSGSATTTLGDQRNQPQAALASSDLYVGPPQRFAFGIVDPEKGPISGGQAQVQFAPSGAQPGPPAPAAFHGEGLEGRGVYALQGTFVSAGTWEAHISLNGKALSPLPFDVTQTASLPAPGSAAPRAPSPTTANALGVNPICTRNPVCPLHAVSLDRVIGAGKPVAVIFATPARCQTRFCGPTLDMVLNAMPAYGDRITFVHVEIYKDLQSQENVPTLGPWRLESEPWLFGIDGGGTVKGRLDGAFDATEVKSVLDALVA